VLSFFVVNLLLPGDPRTLSLGTPSGTWTLERFPEYARSKAAIAEGQCANTYYLEHPVTLDAGAAVVDTAFNEITPILLGASYATGMSVTVTRSTMASEVMILQPSDHWPRERAMGKASPIINSSAEFIDLVQLFVRAWAGAGRTEKALLLIHHWLDALSCWSMEDLYLSATTLLQVIVATEASKQGLDRMNYYPGVTDAAKRLGIQILSNDFKNMRNELIHDGRLIGARFAGPDKAACARVVAEVLNWFDAYMHVALALGALRRIRFGQASFMGLNAYSIN
jgi:hypothetical protein